jgi:ABC-type lipoprotein release transport system permease subunit
MYFKLAWRNLWRNSRRTLITVSSIMFAVFFALFLESIERGSHDLMVENMTRFHTGYLQVQDFRFEEEPSLDNALLADSSLTNTVMKADGRITYTIPRLETFMLAAGREQTRGAMVMGIDAEAEQRLNGVKDKITQGKFFEPGDGTVVVSAGLASRLELSVGDSLVLLGQGRFGMSAAGKFPISGLIEHPLREMNNQTVFLSLSDAQWLTSAEERVTSLIVMTEHPTAATDVAHTLEEELSEEYNILTWQKLIPDLLAALEFDRASSKIYMGVLYVIIGFGIFGTILTMTLERMKEFAILLSVGMSRLRLALTVYIETFLMSILGTAAGFVFGFGILLYFRENPIRLTGDTAEIMIEFGLDPILPAALAPDIFVWQGLVVFCLTAFICFYPSIKIFRMKIVESVKK